MAKVISVHVSKSKGTAKEPVDCAELVSLQGVKGDAHAGPGDRQVSLLALESYQRFAAGSRQCLKQGSFGENILTEGIELHKLAVGTRLKVGGAVLEVSRIGKECHAPCQIARTVGSCIMPKEGIFARVIKSGKVRPGDLLERLISE